MKNLKPFIAVLLSLAIHAPYKAEASPFVEVGTAHYQKPSNGTWWQDQYPHLFDLDSGYIRFGYGERLRLSFFDLGHYETGALATGEEEKYFSGACNVHTCAPGDYYRTRGGVKGFALSSVLRWGPVYFEPGLTYVQQKFDLFVEIQDVRSVNAGPVGRFLQCTEEKNGIGYILGIGVEYKRVTLSLNYFKNDKSAEFEMAGPTPGIDTVTTLAAGYRF